MDTFITLKGQLINGHGIASGRSAKSPYPHGSVAMQAPFFAAQGLDFSNCFMGTLNVSIAPETWTLRKAQYRFENLRWTHLHPPETFSFVRCWLRTLAENAWVDAWLYYPHPETKKMHLQAANIMEIIATRMQSCTIASEVELRFESQHISLQSEGAKRAISKTST